MENFLSDNQDYTNTVLEIALDIGENLLKSGGEVSRAEDTVTRICTAYGASEVAVFAITSMINATIRIPPHGYATQIRRVSDAANHFDNFERYNKLSRDICDGKLTLAEAKKQIADIKSRRGYPGWIYCLGAALSSGAFAVFFGGTLYDGLSAAAAGLLISMPAAFIPRKINRLAHTLLASFLAGLIVMLFISIGFGNNVDKVMIGTVMLLIPGVSFGNSLRDLIVGDHLSGSLRMVESILLAVTVAVGYWLAVIITGGLVQL